MAIQLYKKKPVEIYAVQWTGKNIEELRAFVGDKLVETGLDIYIDTLEGQMRFNQGDYIIQGVEGEFYPCVERIFRATYELTKPTVYDGETSRELLRELRFRSVGVEPKPGEPICYKWILDAVEHMRELEK